MKWGFFVFTLFLSSLLLTYCVRIFSLKKNILDIPNQRSLHQLPIPRGGGLAFVTLFYIVIFLLRMNHLIPRNVLLALLGGIPIACVGYWDDIAGVKARWRALAHVLSAVWGLSFIEIHSFLFFAFSVVIIVWFVNLYNFMDGIDGLAATEAVFVSAVAGSILLLNGFDEMAYVCFALCFAVLGFLMLNWPPAKIFMGDVGSGFLGYVFGIMMLVTHSQHQLSIPIWCILLSVFIVDASYTLMHRMMQKKKWWLAHREHGYQRLAQSGLSHRYVTIGILCTNVFICLPLALIYREFNNYFIHIFYIISLLICFGLVWFSIIKKDKTAKRSWQC